MLGKTLGVPLFQEQAMQIAIIGAGFTPEEADRLRRSLATFKNVGTIHTFRERFLEGMAANGYAADFAERCFSQIEGFGSYGFPESHAASFALLVYASAWLKCHHPAVFACALLNSQPMGFYAPAQIVRDARDHGVEVRPVCVNASYWDNVLEPDGRGGLALRLGFRQIKGMRQDDADWIAAARGNGYRDVAAVWRRAGTPPRLLARLAEADAFASLGLDRRTALWQAAALGGDAPLPLFAGIEAEDDAGAVPLPPMTLGEEIVADYTALRLTLRAHPMALLRPRLDALCAHETRGRGTDRCDRRNPLTPLRGYTLCVRQQTGSSQRRTRQAGRNPASSERGGCAWPRSPRSCSCTAPSPVRRSGRASSRRGSRPAATRSSAPRLQHPLPGARLRDYVRRARGGGRQPRRRRRSSSAIRSAGSSPSISPPSARSPGVVLVSSPGPCGLGPSLWQLSSRGARRCSRACWSPRPAAGCCSAPRRSARRSSPRIRPTPGSPMSPMPFGQESPLALLDGLTWDLPAWFLARRHPTLAVLGDRDAFVPITDLWAIALAYGAETELVRGAAHGLPIDPHWKSLAWRINAWIDERRIGAGAEPLPIG